MRSPTAEARADRGSGGTITTHPEKIPIATVHYPACVFALERHGFFPYERFASNALGVATEVLEALGTLESVTLSFDAHSGGLHPWELNASVSKPSATSLLIQTTPFTPLVLLGVCHRVSAPLFTERGTLATWNEHPERLRLAVREIGGAIGSAVAQCRAGGIGPALRALRDGVGCTLGDLQASADYYDVASRFIVNHEAAHAYVRQFERQRAGVSQLDRRAFEFLADLVATSWLYKRMVVNTPNTTTYRAFRGVSTHDEALVLNTRLVLEAQITVLVFLALASAVRSGGSVELEGGISHPHTLVRYAIQQVHFLTLVLSNYPSAFPEPVVAAIDHWWQDVMLLLAKAGVVDESGVGAMLQDEHFAQVRRAGELADALQVSELQKAVPFLRRLQAIQPHSLRDFDPLGFA